VDDTLHGVRVLLVEDSFDTREGLRIWLRQHGADVFAVGSAEEAFAILPEARPHVLLSDIGLPGEDGYALLRRIRALPADQGGLVPAAAFTAHSTPQDRIESIKAGFWDHVLKPIDPPLLLAVVTNLVRVGAARPAWTTSLGEAPPPDGPAQTLDAHR
jgi:CheY-like chemotaxis protein